MSASIPSLSDARWVTNVAEKADLLISYFFVAEASQTHLYPGRVVSLPELIQHYGSDELQLKQKSRDALESYLRPYFEQVILDVKVELTSPDDTTRMNMTVECNIVDGGETFSLSRLINVVNSKIVKIVDINNNQGG